MTERVWPAGQGYVVNYSTAEDRQEEIAAWNGHVWDLLLRELDEVLAMLVPDYTLAQLKMKFGDLCYYYGLPEGVSEAVARAFRVLVSDAETLAWLAREISRLPEREDAEERRTYLIERKGRWQVLQAEKYLERRADG